MLDMMRKHAQGWFIKVLLGGIVVTFISWGGYTRFQERSNTVAYVNKEAISIQEYERAYSHVLDYYRSQLGGMNDETLKALGLRQKVYDQIVERTLLLQEAKRLGLQASEDELRSRIQDFAPFQVEGHFDEQRYRAVLAANRLTPAQFEDEQRTVATLDKLRSLVTGFAKVSEAEAFADWSYRNEKVAVDYAAFNSADYVKDVQISDQDLAAYFKANQAAFQRPPAVRLGYVALDHALFLKQAAPTEQQVKQEYEANQGDYRTPHQVKARHILFSVPNGATKEQELAVMQKAEGVMAEIKGGGDFAALAKKYSADPGSASKGGELGWFGEGQMVEAFQKAAFALPKGGLGGPVKTQFGYHVIQVEDVKEARVRPFEEVRQEIEGKMARQRAAEMADAKQSELFGQAAKTGNLKQVADKAGVKYVETPFVASGGVIPDLPDSAKVLGGALAKKAGDFDSDPERKEGPVVYQVLDRREAYVPPLAEVRDVVRQKMAAEKAVELASSAAMRAITEMKAGASLQAAAAKLHAKAGHAEPFTRTSSPAAVGGGAAKAAFALSLNSPVGPVPYRTAGGYVVVRLTQRTEATPADFAAHRAETMQQLLTLKRQQMFDQWLKRLHEKADIEVVNKVS